MKVEELINSDRLIVVDGEYTDDTIRQAYEVGKEQAKREVITVISDNGLITPNLTFDDYREKIKIIIDVL